MNKKKVILILFSLIMLSGCKESNQTVEKTIHISRFTDVIFEDGILLPNTEFVWNMEADEFMENTYGADVLDPNSKTFDSQRYFYSEEQNITTLSPPVCYSIDKIPITAKVIYAFHEDGLFKSGYSWKFEEDNIEDLNETLSILINDLNSNSNLIEQNIDIPNLSENETLNFPYTITWTLINSLESSITLRLNKMQHTYLLDITIDE